MPIPSMQPEFALMVVPTPAPAVPAKADFPSRAVAHIIDFCLVAGLSSYLSILTFVLLAIPRMDEFSSFGRRAHVAFAATYATAGAQLFAGSFAFLSVAFLVAVPLVSGKTPGMGLLGLRLRREAGGALTARALLARLAGSYFTYFALGIPCAIAFLREDGKLFQDRLSGTSVVRDQ